MLESPLWLRMNGYQEPSWAHRAHRVSVVLPPKPQMSLPTMDIWKKEAKLSMPWMLLRYWSHWLRLSPSHLPT